uniref:Uncharacterized protein n=1 Tax=Leersia perrieri TaxID=77586 RepID=A0A0D9VZ47_9ORYZ
MAEPASRRPLPSLIMLEKYVLDYGIPFRPLGLGWASIKLNKKKFHGRYNHGEQLAKSLDLFARISK